MRFYSSFNELYGSQSTQSSPQSVFNRGQWIICNDSLDPLVVDMEDDEEESFVGDPNIDSMYGAYETAMEDARMLIRGYEAICDKHKTILDINVQGSKQKADDDLVRELESLKKGEEGYVSGDEKKKRFNYWYLTMLDGVPGEEGTSTGLRATLNDTRDAIRALKERIANAYKSVGDRYKTSYQQAADTVIAKELRPTVTMINNLQSMVLNSVLGSRFLFGKYAFDLVDPKKYLSDEKLFIQDALKKLGSSVASRDRRDRSLDTFYRNHRKMTL